MPAELIKRTLFLLLLAAFIPAAYPQVKKGVVVPKKLCRADTNYSYAYYLPSYYDHMKSWPVIFVFEPGARGVLGVNTFKEMAEQRGYAIFCSNNARNGPMQLIFDAAEAMFTDVYSRFSLLEERTFLSGFSGGSRVSSLLAMMTGKVNAVIGCGAAFPVRAELMNVNFDYYGITSSLDFNYVEMMKLERTLDSMGVNNAFSIFDGTHEWPPPLEIEMAVLWVEIQDMKQGTLDVDERTVHRYVFLMDSLQRHFDREGRVIYRIRVLENWVKGVEGITATEKPGSILETLLADPQVQKEIADNEALIDRETALHNEIKTGLSGIILPYLYEERTEKWWKAWKEKIDGYKSDSIREIQELGLRLEATVTANCWMECYNYLEEGVPEKVGKFLAVWQIFEPESIGLHWLMAKYHTETGSNKKAVEQLEICRRMGMKNYTRLLADTTFRKLKGYRKFDELILEMDTLR